ncbi:STAS-like domain-containing protein [Brucella sp. HL-2]|nr:STAS-like domain-containing protein [Brucella sp. HL-2]MCV9908311.1 STAS-like domain-containing protein [Brucella sp. HL-2]
MMIDLAKDYSKYPAGRFHSDGTYNGEDFRKDILAPMLEKLKKANIEEKLIIDIDGVRVFGSSFIEEAFGGLIRLGHYTSQELQNLIEVRCTKPTLFFYQEMIEKIIATTVPDPVRH